MSMEAHHKQWNERQTALRELLEKPAEHARAIELCLLQHAMTHSSRLGAPHSFQDEALEGMDEAQMRLIPRGEEHSVAWALWHLARIEDVTMNLLVAGSPQVFESGDWAKKLNAPTVDTGNALNPGEIILLNERINLPALESYRLEVGLRTREVIQNLQPGEIKEKVSPERLNQIKVQGAVNDSTQYLLDYWGGRTIAGLLLMPATRHNIVHLNEILNLKKKLAKI